ncbi:hypothetical protein GCK72_002860 [Caenorhabditis remanei]|uniref:Uncharacterized protein n=1 Tax=Caenorhabditis remanei TaxID=31234 RepID=A0A6A5HW22_CAERE|nr:hypothetical protein GCK72_002860 [Caenorhabditis remanei]KAF1771036.1 hypothetical protein GCK72_002860 [Caenorhabditis remanei]
MKPFLFFLLSVFSVSNACLVIQYSVPPACACKAQKLDSSNIFKNVQEGNIYFYNVTTSIIKAPELKIDDCSVSMYCEEDYKLFVFDTGNVNEEFFGEYPAEGFCNPYPPQKWLVTTNSGELKQFSQLNGVCVKKIGADGCQKTRFCSDGLTRLTFLGGRDKDTLPAELRGLDYQDSVCFHNTKYSPWEMNYWRPTVVQRTYVRFVAAVCADFC